MSQTTNEPNNEVTPEKDLDYVPHDPGGNDFSSMEIESEEPVINNEDDDPEQVDPESLIDPEPDPEDVPDTDPEDAMPETLEGAAFVYDDKTFEPVANPNETETEKAQRLQILELQQKLVKQTSAEPAPLKEPDLYDTGIDGDPDKHNEALKAYYKEQGKREAAQEVENQRQDQRRQQEATIYETNVKNYDTRRAAIKATLPDIDQADTVLAESLPEMHQAAIMCAGLENPEMVVYALFKSPELRAKLAAETNPIRLGIMLADISKKSRLAPKGEKPKINQEPRVKGSQGANPKANGLPKEFSSATFE